VNIERCRVTNYAKKIKLKFKKKKDELVTLERRMKDGQEKFEGLILGLIIF
jgi:hypothetical protein